MHMCHRINRIVTDGPYVTHDQVDLISVLRSLWRELHDYQQNGQWNAAKAESDFKRWLDRIPNFGCSCADHFALILTKLPPRFGSADEFLAWSVAVHNEVNISLSKPIYSLEQARLDRTTSQNRS